MWLCLCCICSLRSHQLSHSRRRDDVLIELVDHSGPTPFHSSPHHIELLLPPHNSPLPSSRYISIDKVSDGETAARIKQAVLRLDGFTHDALQPARKEGYIKIVTMLKYIADSCTLLMACIVVASTDVDRPPSLSSCHPLTCAQQSSSFVPCL